MPTRRWSVRVGAAAVPEAADPDEDAALGHLGGDGVVGLERVRGLVAQVAARDEAGRPVLLGEVGDRPHGVADDRDVRPGQRDELVVGVDRLRLLVRADGDGGEGGDEEPRIEHALDDGEHVGMDRDLLEGLSVDEEVVDPRSCAAPRRGCRPGRCRGRAPARRGPRRSRRRTRVRWRSGGWCSRPRRSAEMVIARSGRGLVASRGALASSVCWLVSRPQLYGVRGAESAARTDVPTEVANWPGGRVCANGAVGAVGSALA